MTLIAPTLDKIVFYKGELQWNITGWIDSGDALIMHYGTDPTWFDHKEITAVVDQRGAFDFGIGADKLVYGVPNYFRVQIGRGNQRSAWSPVEKIDLFDFAVAELGNQTPTPTPPPTPSPTPMVYKWAAYKSGKNTLYRILENGVSKIDALSLTETRWLCGILKITPP